MDKNARGSGKTIVAVFLFKYLRDYTDEQGNAPYRHKKIGIVIPQTSLRATIKTLFSHIDGLKASEVLGPSDVTKERYDILLVDEAHRLHQRKNIPNMGSHDGNNQKLNLPQNATELDWIFHQTDCPILFYDSDQVVGPSGPMPSQLVLTLLIRQMYDAGIAPEDITVVFALGSHRKQTDQEKRSLVGDQIFDQISCIDADPRPPR